MKTEFARQHRPHALIRRAALGDRLRDCEVQIARLRERLETTDAPGARRSLQARIHTAQNRRRKLHGERRRLRAAMK